MRCPTGTPIGFDMTKQENYRIPLLDATLSSQLMNPLLLNRTRIDDLKVPLYENDEMCTSILELKGAVCHDCFQVIVTLTHAAHLLSFVIHFYVCFTTHDFKFLCFEQRNEVNAAKHRYVCLGPKLYTLRFRFESI